MPDGQQQLHIAGPIAFAEAKQILMQYNKENMLNPYFAVYGRKSSGLWLELACQPRVS
jgi:hypothetical protein